MTSPGWISTGGSPSVQDGEDVFSAGTSFTAAMLIVAVSLAGAATPSSAVSVSTVLAGGVFVLAT